MKPKHRPAAPLLRWYLKTTGYRAVTMPWGVAHYLDWPPYFGLMQHEEVHLEQIARYGSVGFALRYAWGLLLYGYEMHPLEIEARNRSGHR